MIESFEFCYPPSFVSDLNSYSLADFVSLNPSYSVKFSFSNEIPKKTFFPNFPREHQKQFTLLLDSVFSYLKIPRDSKNSKSPQGTLDEIVPLLKVADNFNESIITEILVLLFRQLVDPPAKFMTKILQIMLLIVTIAPLPQQILPYLKSHLARLHRMRNHEFESLSLFVYLRIWANEMKNGKIKIAGDFSYDQISMQYKSDRIVFGVSIYEQMYFQRTEYPKAPFPILLHHFCEKLFELGAEKSQGIFRLAGSRVNINRTYPKANQGEDFMNIPINDLSSILKKWFSKQPGRLIDSQQMEILKILTSDEEYTQFADSLPELAKNVLKYLIGFLRKLALAEEITKMNAQNLSMVFAPNIAVYSKSATEVATCTSLLQRFLSILVGDWYVSDIYPIKEEWVEFDDEAMTLESIFIK